MRCARSRMGVGHNRTGRIDTEMELKFKFKLIVCETGRSTDVEEVLHRAMGRVDTRVEAAVGCRGRVPSPVCRAAMKSKPSNSLYTRGADRLRERAHYGHAHDWTPAKLLGRKPNTLSVQRI